MLKKMPHAEAYIDNADFVRRLCERDEPAVRKLYNDYARYVASIAYRLLGDDADLDDVVQDTFVSAIRSIKDLKDPSLLKIWIARIAVRRSQRYIARRKRRKYIQSGESLRVPEPVSSSGESYYEIYETLHSLPRKYSVPWILYKVVGMKLAEVGDSCGCSLATTKRRIARAEEMLKRRLDV